MHGSRLAIWIAGAVCALALAGGAIAASVAKPAAKPHYPGNAARGYIVFRQALCYTCHTLKAAGPDAYGTIGADLEKYRVPYVVAYAVVNQGIPAQPPDYPIYHAQYRGALTRGQMRDVANFVATYSGTYAKCVLLREHPPKLACTRKGRPY